MNRSTLWKAIPRVFPALPLLPLLGAPVPTVSHHAREIAGYFQTLALLRDGALAYTYYAPVESYSSLHLHSLLSTPLLELGYMQAGRAVSLGAAIVSATILSLLAGRLCDRRAAFLAPAFLWLHPAFMRFASRWWPETVSIALTTAAVYFAYRDTHDTPQSTFWYILSCLAVFLAITNHLWEATIALPITVLYLFHHRLRRALGVVGTVLTSLAVVEVVHSFEPPAGHLFANYGILNYSHLLLDPGWYFRLASSSSMRPMDQALRLTLPIAVIGLAATGWWAWRTRAETPVVMSAWLLSGLAIPFALPRGFTVHMYYVWALLPPLALVGTLLITTLLNRQRLSISVESDTAVELLVTGLILLSAVHSVGIEAGGFTETNTLFANYPNPSDAPIEGIDSGEAVQAGHKIAEIGVTKSRQIVFLGQWGQTQSPQYWKTKAVTRILMYSGVLVRERSLPGDGGPRFNSTVPTNCTVAVSESAGQITVSKCE